LLQSGFSSTNVVDFEKGMTYFCRISIFAVKNTQKYLVFDPSEIYPYSVRPNYASMDSTNCEGEIMGSNSVLRVRVSDKLELARASGSKSSSGGPQ
jgi:hypothetical protein